MKKLFVLAPVLMLLLLGLPLLGVLLAGMPIGPYLEFPPRTRYVAHAPFSWPVFLVGCAFVAAVAAPFIIRAAGRGNREAGIRSRAPFPWWGWAGVAVTASAWLLAWSRFPWFAPLQPHTFTPLWIGYILTVNGLTRRRAGSSLMIRRPRFFLLLFPASALFWWFFEYLNRFVQNWYYTGASFGPWEYFVYATLPFSTVLPAVLSTREWLLTFPIFERKFVRFMPVALRRPERAALLLLAAAAAGLGGIGIWPNALYPLLWIAPFLIIVSVRILSGEGHVLRGAAEGDWRVILASASAALVCGFFWEMWNFGSLAKWIYEIPYVQRFRIFEMPLLGYAGYLPFGLECAAVAELVAGRGAPAGKKTGAPSSFGAAERGARTSPTLRRAAGPEEGGAATA